MFKKAFDFGENGISSSELYNRKMGYGFITERSRMEDERLCIAEINSAFDALPWYKEKTISILSTGKNGIYIDSEKIIGELAKMEGAFYPGEKRRIPLIFKADVEKTGNYEVCVTLTACEMQKDVLIFAGRRGLRFKGDINANEEKSVRFVVNVSDIIPRGKSEAYKGNSIDIAIVSDGVYLTKIVIREVDCSVVYIAGDSTVTDQSAEYPYAPSSCYSGWGQMLSAFINDQITVSNHAHSGLTTESFRSEGHYEIVEKSEKSGDFALIQFGHNDQKLSHLLAEGGYRDNLLRYIDEFRLKGVAPLIVTPLARNTWHGCDGKYNDLLYEYAKGCKKIGKEMNVPVCDLHEKSMELIKKLGLENAKTLFYPKDYTHTNDYGAYLMASFVSGEIKKVCYEDGRPEYVRLAECITDGFGEWKTAGIGTAPTMPAVYMEEKNENKTVTEVNLEGGSDEPLKRVDAFDMLIRKAGFFPVNVYNDMFTDVVGHEWYAGTVECAYQNGLIIPWFINDGKIEPEKEITLEEFVACAMCAYGSRRKLPKETETPLDKKCSKALLKYVRYAYSMKLIDETDEDMLRKGVIKDKAFSICEQMNI